MDVSHQGISGLEVLALYYEKQIGWNNKNLNQSSYTSWDFSIFVSNNTKKSRFIEISSHKCVHGNGSNFFVFENYEIRFSGFVNLHSETFISGVFRLLGWFRMVYTEKIPKIIQKNRKRKIGYTKTDGYSP